MIRIVTDTTCYLADSYLTHFRISLVPLKIHFPDLTFAEGTTLTADEFYHRLETCATIPMTSQPSMGEFKKVFEELTENGDSVLALSISSKISGTYMSACAAKEALPDRDITVVDTLSTCLGLGFMAIKAGQMIEAGCALPEILEQIQLMIAGTHINLALESLDYLQKGGRIGKASAMIGTLLKVKPIISLSGGEIVPLDKVRSRKKVIARLVEEAVATIVPGQPFQVAVMHACCPDDATALAAELRRQLNCDEVLIAVIGPTIGTHLGPQAIGVIVYQPVYPVKIQPLEAQALASRG
jgi:DegV family protein with EDD domain